MIDNWRKSTYSVNDAACVEVGWSGGVVGYQDSKQGLLSGADRPQLLFGKDAAGAFLRKVKMTAR